jgi:hypothetical protein
LFRFPGESPTVVNCDRKSSSSTKTVEKPKFDVNVDSDDESEESEDDEDDDWDEIDDANVDDEEFNEKMTVNCKLNHSTFPSSRQNYSQTKTKLQFFQQTNINGMIFHFT